MEEQAKKQMWSSIPQWAIGIAITMLTWVVNRVEKTYQRINDIEQSIHDVVRNDSEQKDAIVSMQTQLGQHEEQLNNFTREVIAQDAQIEMLAMKAGLARHKIFEQKKTELK